MSFITRLTRRIVGSPSVSTDNGAEETKETSFSSSDKKTPTSAKELIEEKRASERSLAQSKVNVNAVYNKNTEYKPVSSPNTTNEFATGGKVYNQFLEILEAPIIDYDALKKLSWSGIPSDLRSKAWRVLLKYMPTNREKQESTLQRKRTEYKEFVKLYIEGQTENYRDENEKKILKIILSDVPRTQPDCPIFHIEPIQKMLIRILHIWNVRHPASGYVQGINDLTTPFVAVFLSDYVPLNLDTMETPKDIGEVLTDKVIEEVEADTYWCLCKILDGILDNYTNSQPGVLRALGKIREVSKKMDSDLFDHFDSQGIVLQQFAFRWVYCLLIREFPLKLGMRLFDTYISDDEGFSVLHIYVCTAILLKWANKLKRMSFNDLMLFLQCLPTKEWREEDLNMLIAEAYVFKTLFEGSKGHLQS